MIGSFKDDAVIDVDANVEETDIVVDSERDIPSLSQTETSLAPILKTVESLAIPTLRDIESLTNEDLARNLNIGGTLIHISSRYLQAYAILFHKRFKAAKKAKEKFCGEYRSDFKLACPELTGYSEKQIRRIETGNPSPKPSAPKLTAEEINFRNEAKATEALIASDKRARKADLEARKEANLEISRGRQEANTAGKFAVAVIENQPQATPIVVVGQPIPNAKVAASDARDLDEAIEILRTVAYSFPSSGMSDEMKVAKKLVTDFLHNHGGLGPVPAPLPAKKKGGKK
jgi:hypothetical protein